MKKIIFILSLFVSIFAFAGGTTLKQIDSIENSTGGVSVGVPGVGNTFLTDTNSITVTNKTMSGAANTFSLIPVGAIGNGSVLSGSNSGDITLGTASGLSLIGQQLSLGLASSGVTGALSGTDYTSFAAKQTALTFSFPLQNSANTISLLYDDSTIGVNGSNQIYVKNAGITTTQMSSGAAANGAVATANGSGGVSYVAPASNAPIVNGSASSPLSITATGITLSTPGYVNGAFISGSSSGTTTVTGTPSITACTAALQTLVIIGESATNLVKLQDQASLPGSALALNGPWTSNLNSSLSLVCDGNGIWVETARQQ